MAGDRAQRTEQPTGKRLAKARDEGNVPRTKELSAALALLGFVAFAHVGGAAWLERLRGLMSGTLQMLPAHELNVTRVNQLLSLMLSSLFGLLAAPLAVIAAAGVGGNLLQGPPPLTVKPLQPDFKKLNPINGLKKLFRLKGWVEMLKSAVKMVLFTAIAVTAVREALVTGLPGSGTAEGTYYAIATLCGRVIRRVALLALALAFFDWLFNRFDHSRQLMMTKQEVKDEQKESDGDPLVKARLKSKQMALSRSRMMADVPKATVVVTNPTHFAVALQYTPGEADVPKLLAKGRGTIAAKIREVATKHGVPIVSDPPLARALFRSVEVGQFVPQALFRAVAEVLALVLRPDGRRRGPGEVRR